MPSHSEAPARGRPLLQLLAAAALLAILPTLAQAQKRHGRCIGEAPDTTAVDVVFRECDTDRAAKVRTEIRPLIRPEALGAGSCFKTELEFVVDTSGAIEPAGVQVVSGNSQELGQAVMASLGGLRYTPAMRDGHPVRQRTRYGMSIVRQVSSGIGPGRPPVRPPC